MSVFSILLQILFFGSITGYLLGVVLQSKPLHEGVERLWYATTNHEELDRRAHVIQIVERFIDAVYRKNGKLSWKKLLAIVVMLNTLFAIGIIVTSQSDMATPSLGLNAAIVAMLVLIFSTANIVWELLSYLITSSFIKRAVNTGRIRYVFYDVIVLFVVLFAVPLALITGFIIFHLLSQYGIEHWEEGLYSSKKTQISMIGAYMVTPVGPIMAGLAGVAPKWVAYPAALSICLPTMIFVTSLLVVYNRYTLHLLQQALLRLSDTNAPTQLRNSSLGVFGLVSGLLSYFGVPGVT